MSGSNTSSTPTITYVWTITNVNARVSENSLTNVIKNITCLYTGTSSDGISVTQNVNVVLPTPNTADFIPYENLTQSQIISWVESKIALDKLQKSISSRIDYKRNPVIVSLPINFQK